MSQIAEILSAPIKPKEKQTKQVEAVMQQQVSAREFMDYFVSAPDVDKGNCADAMKHISASNPAILATYIDLLLEYINHKLPRVKWGVTEAMGNLSKNYPEQTAKAIPYLLKNITDDSKNTTVIRWCATFALTEIARNNSQTRSRLLPVFEERIKCEKNNGVRNIYLKALKVLG